MKRFAAFLNFRMAKLIFCVKEARCRRGRQPSDREAAPKGTASPDHEVAPQVNVAPVGRPLLNAIAKAIRKETLVLI